MIYFTSSIYLILILSFVIKSYQYKGYNKRLVITNLRPVKLQILSSRKTTKRLSSKLYVIEHMIDCVANPAIADIYGGMTADICIQSANSSTSSIFRGVGGLLEQAFNIGFLVMSYFFFKRNANGISDWDDADDDDNEIDDRNDVEYRNNNERSSPAAQTRRCVQCNGRGKFEFNNQATSICDLCGGTGSIMRSKRQKPLGLPPSSRQLWSDIDDDDSDANNMNNRMT